VLKGLIRFGVRVAVVAAAVWIARATLKRWVDGPDVEPTTKPWPPVASTPAPAPRAESAAAGSSVKARPTTPGATGSPKTPRKASATKETGDPPPGAQWVKPDGSGAVPTGHPVKAKLRSRLYHLPGMVAYERTDPDRCYATPEAAEEDGFSPAKR